MEVLLAGAYLFTVLILSQGAIFSSDFETKIVSYIEKSMKCHNVPGMTLSVVKGDEVWSHGFGKEDLDSGKMVDSDSRFNIGSITKSFTATLLGILLSEKGMNWTSKVTDILGPTYEFIDPYRTKELTLRDLLSHRTGLARLDFGATGAGISKSVSRSDFCRRMKYLPEEIPIRDGLIYNNYMFMMAGHAAKVLGQDTWENLVASKIFQPIGMNSTKLLLSPSDVLEEDTARPYVYVDDQFVNGTYEVYELHPMEPAGAVLSTATDMSKWIKFHLSLGKTESGVQLLDQEVVKDMHRVTTPMNRQMTKPKFPADDVTSGYGYGFFISEYRGYKKVYHSGGMGAYISLMWTFPDMDIGIFGSVNGVNAYSSNYHLAVSFYYIADHLLGLQTWLNESTACTFPEPWDKIPEQGVALETPISVGNVAELVGSYGNNLFPDVNVYSKSTDIHMDSNKLHGILHPSSEKDRFLFELITPYEYALPENNHTLYNFNVTFNRDGSTQAVNAITLKLEVDLKYDRKPGPQIIG